MFGLGLVLLLVLVVVWLGFLFWVVGFVFVKYFGLVGWLFDVFGLLVFWCWWCFVYGFGYRYYNC